MFSDSSFCVSSFPVSFLFPVDQKRGTCLCSHCVPGKESDTHRETLLEWEVWKAESGYGESPCDILHPAHSHMSLKQSVTSFTLVTFRISIYVLERSLFSLKLCPYNACAFTAWHSSGLKKERLGVDTGNISMSNSWEGFDAHFLFTYTAFASKGRLDPRIAEKRCYTSFRICGGQEHFPSYTNGLAVSRTEVWAIYLFIPNLVQERIYNILQWSTKYN